MTRKSIVRAACVIAAGLAIFTSMPAKAAPSTADAEQSSKPLTLVKSSKPAAKTADRARKAKVAAERKARLKAIAAKKAEHRKAADKLNAEVATMSPDVANARAELTPTAARGAAEITESSAPMDVAAAEQLNELDRAMNTAPGEDEPRAIKTELVTNDRPQDALPVAPPESLATQSQPIPQSTFTQDQASVSNASNDAWAQSSLIGKIFIAFGGLLTLASAARMLIA